MIEFLFYRIAISEAGTAKANPAANQHFNFRPELENNLVFNSINGFKRTQQHSDTQQELLSKLERPDSGVEQRSFTITGEGIFLRKGEEMGMFEMGSTIVMLFECPKDT